VAFLGWVYLGLGAVGLARSPVRPIWRALLFINIPSPIFPPASLGRAPHQLHPRRFWWCREFVPVDQFGKKNKKKQNKKKTSSARPEKIAEPIPESGQPVRVLLRRAHPGNFDIATARDSVRPFTRPGFCNCKMRSAVESRDFCNEHRQASRFIGSGLILVSISGKTEK